MIPSVPCSSWISSEPRTLAGSQGGPECYVVTRLRGWRALGAWVLEAAAAAAATPEGAPSGGDDPAIPAAPAAGRRPVRLRQRPSLRRVHPRERSRNRLLWKSAGHQRGTRQNLNWKPGTIRVCAGLASGDSRPMILKHSPRKKSKTKTLILLVWILEKVLD